MTLYDKIIAETRKRMPMPHIGYDPAIAFQLLCEEVEAIQKNLLSENSCSAYNHEKQICIDTNKPCDYCFKG